MKIAEKHLKIILSYIYFFLFWIKKTLYAPRQRTVLDWILLANWWVSLVNVLFHVRKESKTAVVKVPNSSRTNNFEYKIDHISIYKNRKNDFTYFSEHCASFETKKLATLCDFLVNFSKHFAYKIDHTSKNKDLKNGKNIFVLVSAHCASFIPKMVTIEACADFSPLDTSL